MALHGTPKQAVADSKTTAGTRYFLVFALNSTLRNKFEPDSQFGRM
jgi:hypothetical protein